MNMRCFVILCTVLAVPVLCAQEGYKYREPAPVLEQHGLPPCKHATYNFDAATAALISSQTDARIVNSKGQHLANEHNLETAASGYSPQIGGASSKGGSFQGSTNTFSSSQGYVQNGLSSSQYQTGQLPPPPGTQAVNYIPLSQIPPPPQPAPQGHPITQIPPPISIVQSQSFSSGSSQAQGYSYQQNSGGSQQFQPSSAFPPPPPPNYKPQAIGLTPPGPHSGAASQHSSNFGAQHSSNFGVQHSANFGSQHGSNSNNFGNQHGSNFGGQHANNFAGSHSAASHASNFGAASHTSNFGAGSHASNFGAGSQSSNFGAGSHGSNFGSGSQSSHFGASNFANQHPSNFGGQHSSNFANQQQNSAAASELSSNFASQLASNFGAQQHGILSTFASSNLGANGLNGHLGSVIRETVANAPLDPTAEKHIYVHIPPEDIEGSNQQASLAAPQFVQPPKKHYKIVFIKAPSHNAPNYSQLAAAAAPKVEEKTLIYVLVKKPEEPSVEQIQELTQNLHKTSKPEVYFIKYKTQKEGEAIPQHLGNLPADQIDLTNAGIDTSGLIDIRAGGSATSSITVDDGPKHELYGVPLQ